MTDTKTELPAGPSAPGGQALPATTDREFTVKARSRGVVTFRRFLRHRAAMFGSIGFLLLVAFALFGGIFWTAGINPDYDQFLPRNGTHPFGTDDLGRDMLGLVIRGTQFSLLIALVVAVVSTVIGVSLGAWAGYKGGLSDTLVNRLVELFLILPSLVVVAVMSYRFQGSWIMVSLFLGLTLWMSIARIIRGMVLSLREKEYVEAARALGASTFRIIFKHIVPNTADVIIVNATLTIASAVLSEAALSFIGLGVKPPDTSLGLVLNQTQAFLPTEHAILFWIPLGFIVLMSLSVNFIGDGLRDALDPRANKVRA